MMKVQRNEILDLGSYEQIRERFRAAVIAEKQHRRFVISDEMSIVFENHTTVLFQIQEMLRTERITRESAIQHEIDTYNDLIPGARELSATAFIEIAERETRERRLVELAGLENGFALSIDGEVAPARNETRGVLPERTTAVHYMKFPLSETMAGKLMGKPGARAAVKLLVRHPRLQLERELPVEIVRALAADLLDPPPQT